MQTEAHVQSCGCWHLSDPVLCTSAGWTEGPGLDPTICRPWLFSEGAAGRPPLTATTPTRSTSNSRLATAQALC